jgi:hypothetical protein
MEIDQVNGGSNAQVDIDALVSNAAESAIEAYNDHADSPLSSRPTETSMDNPRHVSTGVEKGVRSRSQTSAPDIDFRVHPQTLQSSQFGLLSRSAIFAMKAETRWTWTRMKNDEN